MDNNNRSMDLTDLLSRINKQAVLVGGPHDGKRAPLPPVIYNNEHPTSICQPGRPFDTTYYHYQLVADTTYVYVDHCDTLPDGPHHPDQIPPEQEHTTSGKLLKFACLLLILGLSGTISAAAITAAISGLQKLF